MPMFHSSVKPKKSKKLDNTPKDINNILNYIYVVVDIRNGMLNKKNEKKYILF